MGLNRTVLIRFYDGSPDLTLTMNNNTFVLAKMYQKTGVYKILAGFMINDTLSTSNTTYVTVLPSILFKLKCGSYAQVGDLLNCSIIDVFSYANLSIVVDFGDGEQRLFYLENSDIPFQKAYATEGFYTIRAESVDKYLNKTMLNVTVQVVGGNMIVLF